MQESFGKNNTWNERVIKQNENWKSYRTLGNYLNARRREVSWLKERAATEEEKDKLDQEFLLDKKEAINHFKETKNDTLTPWQRITKTQQNILKGETTTVVEEEPVVEPEIIEENIQLQEKENSKEDLAESLANKTKWFMTSGKAPDLDQSRRGMDFEDNFYVRKPSEDKTVQPFVSDRYSRPFNKIATGSPRGSFTGIIHYVETNHSLKPPKGETTLRYLPIKYSDNTEGIVLVLGMTHGRNPVDSRWDQHADFFLFDLPKNEALEFMQQTLLDPSFSKLFLQKLTKQKPLLLDYLEEPTHAVVATTAGMKPFGPSSAVILQKSHNRIPYSNKIYEGNFVISDGEKIEGKNLNKEVALDDSEALDLSKLGIETAVLPLIQVDRDKADQEYTDYNSLPQEVEQKLKNISGIKSLERYLSEIGNSNEFTVRLANSLFKVIRSSQELIFYKNTNSDKIDVAVDQITQNFPDRFGLKGKIRSDLIELVQDWYVVKTSSSIEEVKNAFTSIDILTSNAMPDNVSQKSGQDYINQIDAVLNAKDKPDELLKAFENLSFDLTRYCNLDMKLFLNIQEEWDDQFFGWWKKRQFMKLLQKDEGFGNKKLLEKIRKWQDEKV